MGGYKERGVGGSADSVAAERKGCGLGAGVRKRRRGHAGSAAGLIARAAAGLDSQHVDANCRQLGRLWAFCL